MEFQLKTKADSPMDLVLTYWGNRRFGREFQILVDGKEIASETLADMQNNVYFDKIYPLPEDVTKGKSVVTVRIEASATRSAGAVAGARAVTRKS